MVTPLTPLSPDEMAVLDALELGPTNYDRLADVLDLPRRNVEAAVQSLRLRGAPIVTSGRGAWLAADAEELERCTARLRERAVRQLLTVRAMRGTVRRMRLREAEQLELDLGLVG